MLTEEFGAKPVGLTRNLITRQQNVGRTALDGHG